jgi:hypothetical protein
MNNFIAASLVESAVTALLQGDRQRAKDSLNQLRVAKARFPLALLHGVEKLISALDHRLADAKADKAPEQSLLIPQSIGCSERPGVTLVTCARNRTENLLRALSTWIKLDELSEIIVVDWSSEHSVAGAISAAGFTDDRIRVVHVTGEARWILSPAFNLGFRIANCERILKADADIEIRPDFFEKNSIAQGEFVAGDWRVAAEGQEHINGFFYICARDLGSIHGFNEFIDTYGWDDDDLYERLEGSGIRRKVVNTSTIWHIPHDDNSRIESEPHRGRNALDVMAALPEVSIRSNRYLSLALPTWCPSLDFTEFVITQDTASVLEVARSPERKAPKVPESLKEEAKLFACAEVLSWRHGGEILALPKYSLRHFLETTPYDELSTVHIREALESTLVDHEPGSLWVDCRDYNDAANLPQLARWIIAKWLPQSVDIVLVDADPPLVNIFRLALPDKAERIRTSPEMDEWTFHVNRPALRDASTLLARGGRLRTNLADLFHISPAATRPLAIIEKRPKLFIDAQHGLGNRLRAVASAAAIAEATGRELVIVWENDCHCEARFADLFDNAFNIEQVRFFDDAASLGYNCVDLMNRSSGSLRELNLETYGSSDLYVRSAFVLPHKASDWHTENRFLWGLRPSSEVAGLLGSLRGDYEISAHVRMNTVSGHPVPAYDSANNWSADDHEEIDRWRRLSHWRNFVNFLQTTGGAYATENIFVAADCEEAYVMLGNEFGDRMRFIPRETHGRGADEVVLALADCYALSRARLFVGSNWSSFSELAMRFSRTFEDVRLSGKDF